ncbi:MAG: glycosyltransferase family 2 protein [Candidatus Binatia bacterium]
MRAGAPVTVIVPCCNEEAGLPALLARLEALERGAGRGWEMLFLDDGSTDGTFAELLSAARTAPWMTVLRHPSNMGLGAALRTGFANTVAPVVCTIDSDCTYAPERLPELVAQIHAGADIATASAWHPESARAEGGRIRIGLSRAVSGLYKLLIGQDVHTFTCLFRAYRRDSLARVHFRANGFAAVAEIMLRGMLAGYRVAELPMQLEKRKFGASKLKVGDAIAAHAGLLTLTASLVFANRARRLLPGRTA